MIESERRRKHILLEKLENGLTTKDISTLSGFSMSHLNKLMSGHRPISDVNYRKIIRAIL